MKKFFLFSILMIILVFMLYDIWTFLFSGSLDPFWLKVVYMLSQIFVVYSVVISMKMFVFGCELKRWWVLYY